MVERVDSGNHPKSIHKSAIISYSHCVLSLSLVIFLGANLRNTQHYINIKTWE